MKKQDFTFDEWFDILLGKIMKGGWNGAVNKDSFDLEYLEGMSPEQAAKEFLEIHQG